MCLARAIVVAYTSLKDVVVLNKKDRAAGAVLHPVDMSVLFEVVKVNKWGKKQDRILCIDDDRR